MGDAVAVDDILYDHGLWGRKNDDGLAIRLSEFPSKTRQISCLMLALCVIHNNDDDDDVDG